MSSLLYRRALILHTQQALPLRAKAGEAALEGGPQRDHRVPGRRHQQQLQLRDEDDHPDPRSLGESARHRF